MSFLSHFKSPSIIRQLTGWYTVSAFILVSLATSYLYWSLSRALLEENNVVIQDRIQTIAGLFETEPNPISVAKKRIEQEWTTRIFEHVFVKVIDRTGSAVIESPNTPLEVSSHVFPKSPVFKLGEKSISGKWIITPSKHPYFTLSVTFPPKNLTSNIGSLFVALDLSNEEKVLGQYRRRLIFVLLITIIISALFGNKIASAGFSPVDNIVRTAAQIHSTTLHERIAGEKFPIELKTLVLTMNEMLDRLENSFQRLSRFSSDIAHELRTPINNVRGEIEVVLGKDRSIEEYRDTLLSALEECGRISKIIDSLLFLAKAENPQTLIKKEKIILKNELDIIVEFYEASASEVGISIQLFIPFGLTLEVERTLFQRAIGNLLSNAINYTPRGGLITVSAKESWEGITIKVQDNGQGINDRDLPLVFDRFYRADSSRSTNGLGGFGLGLTIVQSILKLHGGRIELQSEKGLGTTAALYFPSHSS